MTQWYVWSSGLERWDPIESVADVDWMFGQVKWSHSKTWCGQILHVYLDETGRFIGSLTT